MENKRNGHTPVKKEMDTHLLRNNSGNFLKEKDSHLLRNEEKDSHLLRNNSGNFLAAFIVNQPVFLSVVI